jgi:hypothetical protein
MLDEDGSAEIGWILTPSGADRGAHRSARARGEGAFARRGDRRIFWESAPAPSPELESIDSQLEDSVARVRAR